MFSSGGREAGRGNRVWDLALSNYSERTRPKKRQRRQKNMMGNAMGNKPKKEIFSRKKKWSIVHIG